MENNMLTFPVATHTYFRIYNQGKEKSKFLADPHYQPVFRYSGQLDSALVTKRLAAVPEGSSAKRSLQLVLASAELQKEPTTQTLYAFQMQNDALFGAPKRSYVEGLLSRIRDRVDGSTERLWSEIEQRLDEPLEEMPDIVPSEETFQRYREYFRRYSHEALYEKAQSLPGLMETALRETGLAANGWRVNVRRDASHAKVHHHGKTISIGAQYQPRTREAVARIVAHEVYGHALRGHQDSVVESEGFAILLEQLLGERFKFRRSYRYLAAGLAWGCIDHQMTFRQTYEIIWRAMVIVGTYDEQKAKGHAFDECARVFRGGNPAIAGAVYLKDGVYFDANVAMWRQLRSEPLTYNEFIDVIEGRRRILQ